MIKHTYTLPPGVELKNGDTLTIETKFTGGSGDNETWTIPYGFYTDRGRARWAKLRAEVKAFTDKITEQEKMKHWNTYEEMIEVIKAVQAGGKIQWQQ